MIFGPDYIMTLIAMFASIAGTIFVIAIIIGFFFLIGTILGLMSRDDAE